MERVDAVIVGAGVVGLAVARALALAGREVIVLDAADGIGTETSSRNSEVIHAGIYYPPGSLKARLCVAGKLALYAYCAERGIPHARCGKLLVATEENQLPKLEAIKAQAEANGVTDLRRLSAGKARSMEPALRCIAAYLSPSTGIIDSHAFMLALQAMRRRTAWRSRSRARWSAAASATTGSCSRSAASSRCRCSRGRW